MCFLGAEQPRWTVHAVLVSEATCVSRGGASACSSMCTCSCVCVRTSLGSAVGHIGDRVPQKWVNRCREGDLAARCPNPPTRLLPPPTRPLGRPPRSSRLANVGVDPLHSLLLLAEWNRLWWLCSCRAGAAPRRTPASVCHSRSVSPRRLLLSAGSVMRKRGFRPELGTG